MFVTIVFLRRSYVSLHAILLFLHKLVAFARPRHSLSPHLIVPGCTIMGGIMIVSYESCELSVCFPVCSSVFLKEFVR